MPKRSSKRFLTKASIFTRIKKILESENHGFRDIEKEIYHLVREKLRGTDPPLSFIDNLSAPVFSKSDREYYPDGLPLRSHGAMRFIFGFTVTQEAKDGVKINRKYLLSSLKGDFHLSIRVGLKCRQPYVTYYSRMSTSNDSLLGEGFIESTLLSSSEVKGITGWKRFLKEIRKGEFVCRLIEKEATEYKLQGRTGMLDEEGNSFRFNSCSLDSIGDVLRMGELVRSSPSVSVARGDGTIRCESITLSIPKTLLAPNGKVVSNSKDRDLDKMLLETHSEIFNRKYGIGQEELLGFIDFMTVSSSESVRTFGPDEINIESMTAMDRRGPISMKLPYKIPLCMGFVKLVSCRKVKVTYLIPEIVGIDYVATSEVAADRNNSLHPYLTRIEDELDNRGIFEIREDISKIIDGYENSGRGLGEILSVIQGISDTEKMISNILVSGSSKCIKLMIDNGRVIPSLGVNKMIARTIFWSSLENNTLKGRLRILTQTLKNFLGDKERYEINKEMGIISDANSIPVTVEMI